MSSPQHDDVERAVAEIVTRAREAQRQVEHFTQEQIDDVVRAIAWSIYEASRARALAERAVADTGLGNIEDKIAKNQRKTLGALRDILAGKSVGVIREDHEQGITEYAKPVGVVAAVVPGTNPAATPANKAMMAVKCRNAVVISPSPKGVSTCALLLEFIHAEFEKLGVDADLIQFLPEPSKPLTYELMRQCDLVVVTGSQKNVRAAYSSGRPAIGVGLGNAAVIIDRSAELTDAAEKIKRSKTFDYATSCSSENSIHVDNVVYDDAVKALEAQGGYLLSRGEKERLERVMWPGGKLSSAVMAKPPEVLADLAELDDPAAREAEFLMVEEEGVGPDFPFSGEKLSVVLTVYRFDDLDSALDRIDRLYQYQGAGHSCGIHTSDDEKARRVAERLNVARVLVNQAHAMGNGGSFDNGLGFTLTMGAGTWARNSISENLSYTHFMNSTRLARVIPEWKPSAEQLFGPYFERVGR
ncbi:MAG: aldehyde dehydrogenase family protein [Actinobacteria bacterium]|nr:aldehyde dehydrogenase family protein [Actinomycetota bacterium]